MNYKHTQIGYLIIIALIPILLLYGFTFIEVGLDLVVTGLIAIVVLMISSFLSLTVVVDNEYLKIKFGYGLFNRRIVLSEIESVKIVKNHWYYGWGIRVWLWPKMIIYNVSGYDAVELKMKDGKIVRVGTDDQDMLFNSLNEKLRT